MESLTIHKKEQKITFQDQNRNIVYLLRFVFGLNLLNSVIFFLLFKSQEDALKWIWLVFAGINILGLWFALTKISIAKTLEFNEIQAVQKHSVLGTLNKLKNGKFRKIFIPKDSQEAEKLMKLFNY